MSFRDDHVEGVLHIVHGLPHFVEGFLLLSKESVVAVCRVEHALVSVVYEVKEIFLGMGMIKHRVREFFVVEGTKIFFKVEGLGGRGNVFFVVVGEGFFLDLMEDFGG